MTLAACSPPSTALPIDSSLDRQAAPRSVFVYLAERGAHHPDERLPAREDLHRAAAALELAAGALLHIVGAKPHVVPVGEVEVGQRISLGLLEHNLGGLGAEDVI